MTFLTGCHPDAPDARDLSFAASPLLGVTPRSSAESFDYRAFDTPRVQVGNSCVGQSIAGSCALALAIAGTPITFPSALFAYTGARLDQAPRRQLVDTGSSLRHAFRWLREHGLIAEERWPETPETINQVPPLDAFQAGECATLEGYYRIESGEGASTGLLAALRRGHCPIFAMMVDDAFGDLGDDVHFRMGGKVWGGHAMVVVGYDAAKDAFIIRNTWSESWGDGGYGLIAPGFMDLAAYDLWVPDPRAMVVS